MTHLALVVAVAFALVFSNVPAEGAPTGRGRPVLALPYPASCDGVGTCAVSDVRVGPAPRTRSPADGELVRCSAAPSDGLYLSDDGFVATRVAAGDWLWRAKRDTPKGGWVAAPNCHPLNATRRTWTLFVEVESGTFSMAHGLTERECWHVLYPKERANDLAAFGDAPSAALPPGRPIILRFRPYASPSPGDFARGECFE